MFVHHNLMGGFGGKVNYTETAGLKLKIRRGEDTSQTLPIRTTHQQARINESFARAYYGKIA